MQHRDPYKWHAGINVYTEKWLESLHVLVVVVPSAPAYAMIELTSYRTSRVSGVVWCGIF